MGKDEVNQLLRERRKKIKQNAKFRKQRIYKHYAKTKDQNIEEINMKDNDNENKEQIEKRKQFYDQYFSGTNPQKDKTGSKEKPTKSKDQQTMERAEKRMASLKSKKKKFIKKMSKDRTSKGQPKMKNYVIYALTKLEEEREKEKIGRAKENAVKK